MPKTHEEALADCEELAAHMTWVSIRERLPEQKQEALLWCSKRGACVGYYELIGNHVDWYVGNAVIGSDADVWDVTHWMPLPEPPSA